MCIFGVGYGDDFEFNAPGLALKLNSRWMVMRLDYLVFLAVYSTGS
jgi:hypothetical protein